MVMFATLATTKLANVASPFVFLCTEHSSEGDIDLTRQPLGCDIVHSEVLFSAQIASASDLLK